MKTQSIIDLYLKEISKNSSKKLSSGFIAYLAALDTIYNTSPKVVNVLGRRLPRHIKIPLNLSHEIVKLFYTITILERNVAIALLYCY